MTKQEFIELYRHNMGLETKKEAEKLVSGLFTTLEEVLVKGEDFSMLGFGKFETKIQGARVCRNPKTGEEIQVAEKRVVKFKVGKSLAEKVAK